MIRSFARAASIGAAAFGALCMAQAASATVFTFTDKGSTSDSGVASTVFNSDDGSLSVKASGWHFNDANGSALSTDTISAASLGYWQNAGMGVMYGSDNARDGTHQIDNYSQSGTMAGADFVMLQFSKDVTIDSIDRNVYKMTGVACCGSDAAYWADTGNIFGAPSTSANIDLTNYSAPESAFTNLPGTGSSGNTALSSGKSASVWLISAAFNQRNDGFKIANLAVTAAGTPTGAVPEPASWALMIVGFGAVGASLRRRKPATLATA